MMFLRYSDAICEDINEILLGSEVMEEVVNFENVLLYLLEAREYFPLLKGTSRNERMKIKMYFVEKWRLFQKMNLILERFDLIVEDLN